MAYIYLLNLYEIIEERLNLYQESMRKPDNSSDRIYGENGKSQDINDQFYQGRIDLLNEFKSYLTDNMNDKLPKRLRKRLSGS